jgi:arginyl-tRNA synthetase
MPGDSESIPGVDPAAFPLDGFRIAVATVIAKALDLPLETAYSGVDLGKKGVDFTVALPRFRLKPKLPELIEKVSTAVRAMLRQIGAS